MSHHQPLIIEVVSDVVCPWCFIGQRRLAQAIALVRAEVPVFRHEIRWRPFFLNPDTPPAGEPYLPFLVQKFGSRAQVEGIWQRIREIGAPLGIDYRFEKIEVRTNTLAAHRLIHWAQQQGDAAVLVEGLFKAQFEQGKNVGDPEVLAQVAATCGHDPATVLAYLLWTGAVGKVSGATAGATCAAMPAAAVLLAALLLGEPLRAEQLFGCCAVILGIVLTALPWRRDRTRSPAVR